MVGVICGIGGGVVIKPVLDSFGVLSVSTISFLSGCTVLAMSFYSVLKGGLSGESLIDKKTGTPLAVGAAIGGVIGKYGFQVISASFANKELVGAVQAACLLLMTLGTLIYTVKKNRIRTRHVSGRAACLVIGTALGIFSSFLGIGGGPVNLVILFYFFSMETKKAAQNSLYIILFSQITSLLHTLTAGNVPEFSFGLLILMVIGGITGGMCGRRINKRLASDVVERLFILLMVVIIFVNIYNIYRFL